MVFYLLMARATAALVRITDFYYIRGKCACDISRCRGVFFISGKSTCASPRGGAYSFFTSPYLPPLLKVEGTSMALNADDVR